MHANKPYIKSKQHMPDVRPELVTHRTQCMKVASMLCSDMHWFRCTPQHKLSQRDIRSLASLNNEHPFHNGCRVDFSFGMCKTVTRHCPIAQIAHAWPIKGPRNA